MATKLTDEDTETLRTLYDQGYTVLSAAILSGRSNSTVSKYFGIFRGGSLTDEERNEKIANAMQKGGDK